MGFGFGTKLYHNLPQQEPAQTCYIEPALAPARVQTQMSNKHNLVLYVGKELVEKSRELGFNLSKLFENNLRHLLTQFSHVNSSNNTRNNSNVGVWWAGPNSNRRPSVLSLRSRTSLRSARLADVLTMIHQLAGALLH